MKWIIRQYEKCSAYLRNQACSSNLADFGLRKGLDHPAQVCEKLIAVTGCLNAFQTIHTKHHPTAPGPITNVEVSEFTNETVRN